MLSINYKNVLIKGFSYYNVLKQMPVRNSCQDLSNKHVNQTFLEEASPRSTSNRLERLRQDVVSGVSVEPLLVGAWVVMCHKSDGLEQQCRKEKSSLQGCSQLGTCGHLQRILGNILNKHWELIHQSITKVHASFAKTHNFLVLKNKHSLK